MAGFRLTVDADFSGSGWLSGEARVRRDFVAGAGNAFVLDARNAAHLWQDTAGTVPVTVFGDPVRRIDDLSGQGRHALLREGATGIPTWQGSGDQRWVDVPLASGFVIDNPISRVSWSVAAAVRIAAVDSGTSFPIISQYGGPTNAYIALQISRSTNLAAINVMSTGGFEVFSAGNMDLGADYVIEAWKNMEASPNEARIGLNGIPGTLYSNTFSNTNSSAVGLQTCLFCSPDNGRTVAGRLYYAAFTRAVRSTAEIADIAAGRAGVTLDRS